MHITRPLRQGQVGARHRLQEEVGAIGRRRPARVDHDEPAAALTPSAPDDLVAHSIMVRCKRPTGIWRGGRFWSAEQVTVPLDELTEEQIERIVTEPLLAFAFVAGEPALTITAEA